MRLLAVTFVVMSLTACAEGSQEVDLPAGDSGRARDVGAATDTAAIDPPMDDDAAVTSESGAIFETECDGGLARCGGACTDTSVDKANCGACGKACATGENCVAGACELVCLTGRTACSGVCVNTNNNEAHCGACGNACATGETCTAGACVKPATTVTFPSTTSAVFGMYAGSGTLGAGGGGRFYVNGDYVQESFARATAATKLTVSFRMSDNTSNYCPVGILTWNVLVNSTIVGSYSWVGGGGGDKMVSQTYSFAAIAPSGGNFTLRLQATKTVCSGGGVWNWYAGGSATLQ